jgi:hypothetical protein
MTHAMMKSAIRVGSLGAKAWVTALLIMVNACQCGDPAASSDAGALSDSGQEALPDGGLPAQMDAGFLDSGPTDSGSMDAGLIDAGPGCVLGTEECLCREQEIPCDFDLACSAGGICEACPWGSEGCPCAAGLCSDAQNVCDQNTFFCRQPSGCEEAGCAQRQLCDRPPGSDALCLQQCENGYDWNAATSACEAAPSCDPAAPGFVDCGPHRACIAQDGIQCGECLAGFIESADGACVAYDCPFLDCEGTASRVCIETASGPQCGVCLPGHLYSPLTDACVDKITCSELTCAEGEVCVEAVVDGSDAFCQAPRPCTSTEVASSSGQCAPCIHCFEPGGAPREGVVGVGNNGFAHGPICVCEVEEGYFQSIDDGDVKRCDADGDGWVSEDIFPVLRLGGGANPFADHHGCHIRTVDRVELRSDDYRPGYGVVPSRTLSIDELVAIYHLPQNSVLLDGEGKAYVELIEPEITDSPEKFALRYEAEDPSARLRPYGAINLPFPGGGGGGADPGLVVGQFTAQEVNPLTKACNHDKDDLNLDSVADVRQSHDALPHALASYALDHTPLFYRLSFFIELNRGFFADRQAGCSGAEPCHGTWVIAEKNRTWPTSHGSGLGFELEGDSTGYGSWKTCARGRDPAYPGSDPLVLAQNSDFAKLHPECVNAAGGCRVFSHGHAHVPFDGRPRNIDADNPGIGPDRLANMEPRWPGMNHHSQFKCVSYSQNLPASDSLRTIPTIQGREHAYTLNDCRLDPRTTEAPLPAGEEKNPLDPVMRCAAVSAVQPYRAQSEQNYWIALAYEDYDYPEDYSGGCIDQGAEWRHLCLVDSEIADPTSFGDLFCHCGTPRAGDDCGFACPDPHLHSNRVPANAELTGDWMCLMPSQVNVPILGDGPSGYTLTGGFGTVGDPQGGLCETDGFCDIGHRLRATATP